MRSQYVQLQSLLAHRKCLGYGVAPLKPDTGEFRVLGIALSSMNESAADVRLNRAVVRATNSRLDRIHGSQSDA